ncbi:MAG: tetratricopeptide repeat protein, partial [Bacteroidales bacterium]|nr:tetratricopeptide repeat protein [Bacteroidales bacterium]
HKGKPTTKTLTRHYMQDLYRFFHLCSRRHAYTNPFGNAFVHQTLNGLTDIIVLPAKCLCAMAELDIQRKDYEVADTLFSLLMLHHPQDMDATLWQKAGYCRQMAKRYRTAIEAFTMSDVLMPGHPWTMLHLAQCYRKNGNDERALEYYKGVEEASPNDMRVLWQEARLLMRLRRDEEALPLLQRLAYEEPDTQKILSLLTEAYLRTGRVDQAVKQADRMMSLPQAENTEEELFTAACAYWQKGRREEALTLFQHAGSFDDKKALSIGLSQKDIPFLRDLIFSLNR